VEAALDLLVAEAGVRAVVVRVDRDAGRVEFLLDAFEMIERRLEPPRPKILARLLHVGRRTPAARWLLRLELRRPHFAFTQAAGLHRRDDRVRRVAAGRAGHLA